MTCQPYQLPDFSWRELAGSLAEAEDYLARLDERVQKSEIAEGWRSRTHFYDAVASMWLDGEAVQIEDLVLHDAMMDVRAPSNELTKAHAILRQRRYISAASLDWHRSPEKVSALLGRRSARAGSFDCNEASDRSGPEDDLDVALKTVSEATFRSDALLARIRGDTEQINLESTLRTAKIQSWLEVVDQTNTLPTTLAAVIADDAWTEIEPFGFDKGEGRLMAASLLQVRRKTKSHLALWSVGARSIPRILRRDRKPITRYAAGLNSLRAAADEGMRRHETWLTAKRLLDRKVRGRRSTSHLPALIDLLIAKPLISAAMISKELRVSQRAALDLIAELDVREITGRNRFRAWSIS